MREAAVLGPDRRTNSLVEAARAGDRDAYSELVEPLMGRAIGAATLLTGSQSDAADAVQDALLSAWQGLDALRDPQAFPAWFRQHVVRAAQRHAKRRRFVVLDDAHEQRATVDLDGAVAQRELRRAFRALGEDDRTLLVLHHFWGLRIAETAQTLGIPEGTVKSRIHGAMRRLRAAYDAEARR